MKEDSKRGRKQQQNRHKTMNKMAVVKSIPFDNYSKCK